MKRTANVYANALCVYAPSLKMNTIMENAARLFGALRFWFFSFIFTRLPIRKKRLA